MEAISVQLTDQRVLTTREKLGSFVELSKPRIAFMLVLTAAAGFYLGNIGTFDFVLFFNAMFGTTLLAFGVAALNQYIERDTDRLMTRTENRPLPSGRATPMEALIFGVALCVISEVYIALAVNILTAVLGLIVIVGYVLVYTPLKTRTSASTAIGALPGALPPLMGWTAAANDITLGAWALFVFLFLWQFPHFLAIAWMYKDEYKKAGILMLPVVEPEGNITASQIVIFTIMMIPVSFAPFFIGFAGKYFLIGAIVLGLWFLYASVIMARDKTTKSAKKLMLVSVLYLPLMFALMVIDH